MKSSWKEYGMSKLLSAAFMVSLVILAAAPSAPCYTAIKSWAMSPTYSFSACLQQTCLPYQQSIIGPMYGCPQTMPYPCPPRKVAKCKVPACNACVPCMPCMPTCGPAPCGGYAPQCGPMPCPPPCDQQSAWDRFISKLWY